LSCIVPVIDITTQSDTNGFGVKLSKLMIDHYDNGSHMVLLVPWK